MCVFYDVWAIKILLLFAFATLLKFRNQFQKYDLSEILPLSNQRQHLLKSSLNANIIVQKMLRTIKNPSFFYKIKN